MTPADVFIDFFERVLESGVSVVAGLSDDDLTFRPGPDANSIAWLVWHAARVQDAQVADVAGTEQVWFAQGWVDRFGLDLDPADHGYGHTSEQVAKVRASADLLEAHLRAVHERTTEYLRTLTAEDLDRVVDERWDPPVTLGVRIVSIADDDAQHVGQAAYVRGLLGN
jgi:uncharacterized damage-inducible protein DinB